MPRTRPLRRHFVKRLLARLDAAEALPGIAPPRAIIDALRHRLAELAVARHIDAELALLAHRIHDCCAERRFEGGRFAQFTGIAGAVRFDQRIGPRQASDMARQDMILAPSHSALPASMIMSARAGRS